MKSTAREPVVQVHTSRGEAITTRYGQVVPLTRVVKLRWPGGALNWRWPAAIEVEQGQSRQKLPIQDATRRIIFTLVFTGLGFTLGLSSFLKNRRRHQHD